MNMNREKDTGTHFKEEPSTANKSKIQQESGYPNELQPTMLPPDASDTDETMETTGESLKFNDEANSFMQEDLHRSPSDAVKHLVNAQSIAVDKDPDEFDDDDEEIEPSEEEKGIDPTEDEEAVDPFLEMRDPLALDKDPEQKDPEHDEEGIDPHEDTEDPIELDDEEELIDPKKQDERDPLGDKQIQAEDPTDTRG